jgi:hypothetical protein
MLSTNKVGLGLGLLGLLAACSSGSGSPPPPAANDMPTMDVGPTSFPVMKQTVGAAGGTLVGPAGSVFEGLKVVIPPGALAADTEITVTQSEDMTPLPVGARRIGPQLTLGPATATLAKPASLTLPAVPAEVDSYGSQTGDMKVWRLESGAWARSEPTATAEGLVTIDLPLLTTVAAGVKLTAAGFICFQHAGACTVINQCTAGVGFCTKSYGLLDPLPEPSNAIFIGDNDGLYYMADTPAGAVAAFRVFDQSTGAVVWSVTSAPIAGLSAFRMNASFDGYYWVGTGTTGMAGFEMQPKSTTTVLSHTTFTAGQLKTKTTRYWRRFGDPASFRFAPAPLGVAYDLAGINFGGLELYVPNTQVDDHLVAFSGTNNGSWIATVNAADPTGLRVVGTPLQLPGTFVSSVAVGYVTNGADFSAGTPLAYTAHDAGESGTHVMVQRNFGAPIRLDVPTAANDFPREVLFDQKGGLWIRPQSSAQLFYFPPTGTTSADLDNVGLSSAAVGSPEYLQAIPHRIVTNWNGGGILSINYAGEVVRLTYAQ